MPLRGVYHAGLVFNLLSYNCGEHFTYKKAKEDCRNCHLKRVLLLNGMNYCPQKKLNNQNNIAQLYIQ